jgi:8-oxo-dGTP pyrophosphatase MutT (NUDIX family)
VSINRYVCGFIFDQEQRLVLLIKKKRPHWQFNRLNGVGGRVEGNETTTEAMKRECVEETGLLIAEKAWRYFAVLKTEGVEVHFFSTEVKTLELPQPLKGDERPIWSNVGSLKHLANVQHDLLYLVPMALDERGPFAEIEVP